MAEKPAFGAELRDCFKPVTAWVSHGISWLDELQQFYRDRAALEKEHAARTTALANKAAERKARLIARLSVGDSPTLTPGSLEAASLTTWSVQLGALESAAAAHERFAADLVSRVAEPLKVARDRFEEARRRQGEVAGKYERERDTSYAELRKVKAKYDGVCQEVENRRKKADGGGKGQAAYMLQVQEMNNVKNMYLIALKVTNKMKERYYYEYIPEVIDNLQAINEARVRELNELWMTAAQLEQAKLADEQGQAAHVLEEVPRNEPRLDSMMFARHNVPAWTEPADAQFEPSPVWHDEAVMATDEAARVYLRNVLVKSKTSARDLGIEVRNKQSEAQTAARAGGGDALMDERLISLREEVHGLERRRLAAEVETATITAAAGDLSLGARNHNFRSTTFTIPTNCDCCGERIWGLAAKGFDCRDCGYTCHGKCVMKVPAECPGELSKEEKKRLRAQRQEHAGDMPALAASASTGEISDTLDADGGGGGGSDHTASLPDLTQANTVRSQASTPSSPAAAAPEADKPAAARPRRVMAPPPAQFVSGGPRIGGAGAGRRSSSGVAETGAPGGRMLYAYTATGDDEVSVVEGADVVVEERDDGSGWTKVRAAGAGSGLVPTSYIELRAATPTPSLPARPGSTYSNGSSVSGSTTAAGSSASTSGRRQGPAVAPRRGARRVRHVVALYDYEARSSAEASMRAGERFVLVARDGGGGWSEVECDEGGEKSVKSVPANYVEES